jgi:hypothetical protein
LIHLDIQDLDGEELAFSDHSDDQPNGDESPLAFIADGSIHTVGEELK